MKPFTFRAKLHHEPVACNPLCERDLSDDKGALFVAKIKRWGHSYAVRIPSDSIKESGLTEGSIVDVELTRRHVLDIGEAMGAVDAFCEEIATKMNKSIEEVRYLLIMDTVFQNYEAIRGTIPSNLVNGERNRQRFEDLRSRVLEFRAALIASGIEYTGRIEHLKKE